MSNFDASDPDVECVQCAVCEKEIKGGDWTARIEHEAWMVALCCPVCLAAFEDNPDGYIRRIETLKLMQSPHGIFKPAR